MTTRALAVQSLTTILSSDKKPKDVLEETGAKLDERERAFLMELVYGVLRQRDYLDWLLADFLKSPARLHGETLNNLRIAVYQLRFTRVPEWAAVDEAVNIEKREGSNAALVNAVLRNYLRQKGKSKRPLPKDPGKRIAITASHPEWLISRWISRLGTEGAEQLALRNNEIPLLTLRIDGDREAALSALSEKGIDAASTKYSPVGIIISARGSRHEKEMQEDGAADSSRVSLRNLPLDKASFVVQDEAAQLVSYLLDPQPGERVLDTCAAPGGKTTHMARLMKDQGEVIAVEIDAGRASKITENVSRLGLRSIKIITGDIKNNIVTGQFDRVLLDAPCSSLGVIRRNPDVKYRHRKQDLARFGVVQLALLKKAAGYLKKGGIMVYSVCSTEPEEGEDVITAFLQACTDFSMIEEVSGCMMPFALRDRQGHTFYRTWPHLDGKETGTGYGMDGFFAAKLKKAQ